MHTTPAVIPRVCKSVVPLIPVRAATPRKPNPARAHEDEGGGDDGRAFVAVRPDQGEYDYVEASNAVYCGVK